MKGMIFALLGAVLLMLVPNGTAVAEGPDGDSRTAFARVAEGATMASQDFREEVARSIVEKAKESDQLTRRQKRKIERVMRGGWFNQWRKDAVLDDVIKKLHVEERIVVTPDGVQAAVDWNAILSFVEKLLPMILQLVSLFGG